MAKKQNMFVLSYKLTIRVSFRDFLQKKLCWEGVPGWGVKVPPAPAGGEVLVGR